VAEDNRETRYEGYRLHGDEDDDDDVGERRRDGAGGGGVAGEHQPLVAQALTLGLGSVGDFSPILTTTTKCILKGVSGRAHT
jgi:hypothetical protein